MQLLGRSLRNAGLAAMSIGAVVSERRELTDALGSGEPGQLRLLSSAECRQLLLTESVGRLAYIARSETPDIAVVNYVFDGHDVWIRSGPGPKLQAAERGERVALEVDSLDHGRQQGSSVVVHGTATRVTDKARVQDDPVPWASGPRWHLIRIRPSRLTGRCVG